MPIYEYRRPDGTTFEIQQSFSEETLSVDPDTGVPVERVFHPPAVHFKGKGFYNTDYGTRNRQRETAAAAAEDASSKDGSVKDAPSKDGSSSPKDSSSAGDSSSAPADASKGEKVAKGPAKGNEGKPAAGKKG
jgi:predicted nucleic acid-binding Zn ribbon protein